MATTIQCNCGAVKVEISGEPVAQFYCHCDDCQKVHSAAYVPISMYPEAAVKVIEGDSIMWKLKATPRATCTKCGTRLFANPPIGMRGVVAYFLPKDAFKPSSTSNASTRCCR